MNNNKSNFILNSIFALLTNISLYVLSFIIISCSKNTKESKMSYVKEYIRNSIQNYKYKDLKKYENIDKIVKGHSLTIGYEMSQDIVNIIKKYIVNELDTKVLIIYYGISEIDEIAYNLVQNINFKEIHLKGIFAQSVLYPSTKTYKYIINNSSLSINSNYSGETTFGDYKIYFMKNTLGYTDEFIDLLKKMDLLGKYDISKDINQYIEDKTLLHYASKVCDRDKYKLLRELDADPLMFTKKEKLTVLDLVCMSSELDIKKANFIKFLNEYESSLTKKLIGQQSNKNEKNALIYYYENTQETFYLNSFYSMVKNFNCNLYHKYEDQSIWSRLIYENFIKGTLDQFFKYIIKKPIEECGYEIKEELYEALDESTEYYPDKNNLSKTLKGGPSYIKIVSYLNKMKAKKIKYSNYKKLGFSLLSCVGVLFISFIIIKFIVSKILF